MIKPILPGTPEAAMCDEIVARMNHFPPNRKLNGRLNRKFAEVMKSGKLGKLPKRITK